MLIRQAKYEGLQRPEIASAPSAAPIGHWVLVGPGKSAEGSGGASSAYLSSRQYSVPRPCVTGCSSSIEIVLLFAGLALNSVADVLGLCAIFTHAAG